MSSATKFFGDRVWTPADIDEAIGEDEDWRRYEIVDGVLIVSPHAALEHQIVSDAVVAALRVAAPPDLIAVSSLGIELGRSYRVSDATVVRRRVRDAQPVTLAASDVVLIVEVESPSSITTDRITKPSQYARAGIAHYWRVELDPLRLNVYRLAGEVYEAVGTWAADATAVITDPYDVTIQMSSLLS